MDSSGLRLWLISTSRTHDAGTLQAGVIPVPTLIIPPKSQNFVTQDHCTKECLQQVGNKWGVMIDPVLRLIMIEPRTIVIFFNSIEIFYFQSVQHDPYIYVEASICISFVGGTQLCRQNPSVSWLGREVVIAPVGIMNISNTSPQLWTSIIQ